MGILHLNIHGWSGEYDCQSFTSFNGSPRKFSQGSSKCQTSFQGSKRKSTRNIDFVCIKFPPPILYPAKTMAKNFKLFSKRSVFCFVVWNRYWGIVYSPGVCSKAGQGVHTHEMDRRRTVGYLVLSPLKEPGVAGSSPSTLTTSLATPIPSSSSPNRPSNLSWRYWQPGAEPWLLRVWAGGKFVGWW